MKLVSVLTLKKILSWVAFTLLILLFIRIMFPFRKQNDTLPSKDITESAEIKENNSDAVENKLRNIMKDEPRVHDYLLNDAKVLYVAVTDDGTRRDGLASYFCDLMKDNKIPTLRVKVVEVGTMQSADRDNAYGKKLGEYSCR